MLLQFSVKNYKTFKNKATLSLIASNYDKDTRETENISSQFEEKFGFRVLKSAVVYGANASGKSKLLDAFGFVKTFVINSSVGTQNGQRINVDPFRLNTATQTEPSEFEIIFIANNVLYRYGFEVTNERVIAEWLYCKPNTKEVELFYRDKANFQIHERDFAKAKLVVKQNLVRANALLLSVAAQFNEPHAITVLDWFNKFEIISGLNEDIYIRYSLDKIKNPEDRTKILSLLQAADLSIQNIEHEELELNFGGVSNRLKNELNKFKEELKKIDPEAFSDAATIHNVYNENKQKVGTAKFSFTNAESAGTRKFFVFTAILMHILSNGYILAVDELDSKLHPNLVCKIIELFNSKEHNPKNAQLIFNTHDTNLLSSGLFRRDQIWFTQKNKYGEAKLYSLADFKSDEVKKTDPFEENYIKGKYGAVPFLNFFDNLTTTLPQYENAK